MHWQCGRFCIELTTPKIMGIVNKTPDSFSDGGHYSGSLQAALRHAETMLKDGADILDVGGESTRPGAHEVSVEEECKRVFPVLREIVSWNVPVTLDTRRTEVMRRALEHGFIDAVNDISALRDEGAIDVIASEPSIGVCLMHMKGLPRTMQKKPDYDDVVGEVGTFLHERAESCIQAGIAKDRLLIDPGIGFGKTLEHNMTLLTHIQEWQKIAHDLPVLIGASRKSMLGGITGQTDPMQRLGASIACHIE
ncbi:MAG: dihydropteroate synthase, partial [Eubacteriales bacterium]|nr:dihydropteroate synthase [Eubacteriales bacterium]